MNLKTEPEMLIVSFKIIFNNKFYLFSLSTAILNRLLCFPVYDKHDGPLLPEEEEQRAIAKIKMLGNIKFIGELGKLDLIHESILHKCIKTVSIRVECGLREK